MGYFHLFYWNSGCSFLCKSWGQGEEKESIKKHFSSISPSPPKNPKHERYYFSICITMHSLVILIQSYETHSRYFYSPCYITTQNLPFFCPSKPRNKHRGSLCSTYLNILKYKNGFKCILELCKMIVDL